MNKTIESSIKSMTQGLAYWMAYRSEISSTKIIEADAVLVATDMLRTLLPKHFSIEREITQIPSSPFIGRQRIDLAIKDKSSNQYQCLIEFKLADATNGGYKKDVKKLNIIKQSNPNIDCLIVILYRNLCVFSKPQELVGPDGKANRKTKEITIDNKHMPIRVRRVCNSFSSKTNTKSRKAICIEVL